MNMANIITDPKTGRRRRVFDPTLQAKLLANKQPTGSGPERALVNQQSLGATDEQYNAITDAQRKNAVFRREAAKAAEDTTKTLEERSKGFNESLGKMNSQDTVLVNQLAKNIPEPPKMKPLVERKDMQFTSRPTPTPQQPMVPVSSTGQGLNIGSVEQGSAMVGPQSENIDFTKGGGLGFSLEDYANMTPEERFAASAQAFNQGANMQMQNLQNVYGMQDQMLAQREQEAQAKADSEKARLMAERGEDVDQFREDVIKDQSRAISGVEEAGQKAQESVKQQMAFQGFGRSTKAAELVGSVAEQTAAQIDSIERESNRVIREYQAETLDKVNAKVDKLEARVEQFGDARDQLALQKVKSTGELIQTLYSQNPLNPQNMIKAADEIVKQKAELRKQQFEEMKAIKKEATDNFKYMVENFGSQFLDGLSDEDIQAYAQVMDMPASTLKNIGPTMAEQDKAWERFKYEDSKKDDWNKLVYTNELQKERDIMNFNRDLQKIGINQQFDIEKIQAQYEKETALIDYQDKIKSTKDLNRLRALGVGVSQEYAPFATYADGNGMTLAAPVPHPYTEGNVQSISTGMITSYPNGYRFNPPSKNSLVGQCKWFSQQLTVLENGKPWLGGSSLTETKNYFKKWKGEGMGYDVGAEPPKVGQTILTSDSKTFGHSATINAIKPDGTLVLTESNYKPLTVTHTRTMKPNDPRIIGYLRTKLRPEFQTSKKVINSAGSALKNFGTTGKLANLANEGLKTFGIDAGATISNMFGGQMANKNDQLAEQANQFQMQQEQAAAQEAATPSFIKYAQEGIDVLSKEDKDLLQQYAPDQYAQYMKAINQQGGTTGGAKLNASQQSELAKVNTALSSLDNIINNLGASEQYSPRMLEIGGQNQFEVERNILVENLGRLQSGGAISSDELNSFRNLLPTYWDNQAVREQKLSRLKQMLEEKRNVMGVQPTNQFSQPSVSGGLTDQDILNFYN